MLEFFSAGVFLLGDCSIDEPCSPLFHLHPLIAMPPLMLVSIVPLPPSPSMVGCTAVRSITPSNRLSHFLLPYYVELILLECCYSAALPCCPPFFPLAYPFPFPALCWLLHTPKELGALSLVQFRRV